MPTNFVELADGAIGVESVDLPDPESRTHTLRLTVESGLGLTEREVRAIIAYVNTQAAALGIGPIRWSAP